MQEFVQTSPTSKEIYAQLAYYRHVREATDPVTIGWLVFMNTLGLCDLIPELAQDIDPTLRDDSEFLNYDYQGAYDRYVGLLRSHLLWKTRTISDFTEYGTGKDGGLIKTSLHAPANATETQRAQREIIFDEQAFASPAGDISRTRITVSGAEEDTRNVLFQSLYPHPLMWVPADTPDPTNELKTSVTYIFQGV